LTLILLILKGGSIFTSNPIFNISIFAANAIRDVFLLIIEIALNVVVIILHKRYTDRKNKFSTVQHNINEKNKKINKKNIIIAVVLGFMSLLLHIFTFSVTLKLCIKKNSFNFYRATCK